jgi:hypothetical protein
MKAQSLPVAMLEVCDRARVRQVKPKDGSDIVLEYAEAYQCGLIMEPLDVFREKGTERYIVADGEHRLLALRRTKIKDVECRVHEGDEVAALDFAIGCNQKHGVRRTDRDKYHALVRIKETSLRDKYRTDTELSEKIGVSIRTIKRYMVDWRNSDSGDTRTRAKKQAAQEKAAKHHPRPQKNDGNMTRVMFQGTEQSKENSSATRIGVLNTPPAKTSKSTPAPQASLRNGAATLAREYLAGLRLPSGLASAADVRTALNGEIDWQEIEATHEWLTELLAER